jgi:hypothetical protein
MYLNDGTAYLAYVYNRDSVSWCPYTTSTRTTTKLANRAVFRRCAHSILCTSILTNVLDLPEVAAV